MIDVKIRRLFDEREPKLPLPRYVTPGAAAMDVCAAEGGTLPAFKRHLIPTGFVFAIPDGYEIQVRPRSGMALRNGITVLNTPGTVDSDYRGELAVILVNTSDTEFSWERGDRIAQLVLSPVSKANLIEVDELPELPQSKRSGGFGSTGRH